MALFCWLTWWVYLRTPLVLATYTNNQIQSWLFFLFFKVDCCCQHISCYTNKQSTNLNCETVHLPTWLRTLYLGRHIFVLYGSVVTKLMSIQVPSPKLWVRYSFKSILGPIDASIHYGCSPNVVNHENVWANAWICLQTVRPDCLCTCSTLQNNLPFLLDLFALLKWLQ